MLRVSTTKDKASFIWIPVILVTVGMHVGFFMTAVTLAEDVPRTTYEPSRVAFRTITPAPVPEPETEPKPVPEPKMKEPPAPKPAPKIAKKTPAAAPKPNVSKPAPKPAEPPAAAPMPVFGVTADSVTKEGSGVAVRIGNTLAKRMERTYTKPKNVSPLPAGPETGPATGPAVGGTAAKAPKPYAVYEVSKTPSFKIKIEPEYPIQARRNGVEGIVQLEVLIDEMGRVRKVNVIKSPGHGLDRAAITAVNKSRFNPGLLNGKAVPVRIKIPYRFLLDS